MSQGIATTTVLHDSLDDLAVQFAQFDAPKDFVDANTQVVQLEALSDLIVYVDPTVYSTVSDQISGVKNAIHAEDLAVTTARLADVRSVLGAVLAR